MSRHVDRLLTAYVEAQLDGPQMMRVHQHIAECDGCRAALADRERIVGDLRLALSYGSVPRQAQIDRWWDAIIAGSPIDRQTEQRSWMPSALVPVLLTMLLLILPFTMGLKQGHSQAAGLGMTAVSPHVDATNIAPTQITQTQEPAHWAAHFTDSTMMPGGQASPSAPATPAAVVPAPLAP